MTDPIDIQGSCAPGLEAVREAFAANFTEAPEGLDEQGARFSVVVDGETLVDLWAGWADTAKTAPFTDTTLTSVFSTGKAVMAILMATAVEAGQIDYDQTVASLWPEFGAAGALGPAHDRSDRRLPCGRHDRLAGQAPGAGPTVRGP